MIPKYLSINHTSPDELRKEFLRKVKILHPDSNNDKSAISKFCELMKEYEFLKSGLKSPHFYGKYKSDIAVVCRCGDTYDTKNIEEFENKGELKYNLIDIKRNSRFVECNSCSCFIELED